MRVIDLENINTAMRNEEQFVLRCEEVFHDKIGSAAATILADKTRKPIVALTGPSGSGKTTTAMRLQRMHSVPFFRLRDSRLTSTSIGQVRRSTSCSRAGRCGLALWGPGPRVSSRSPYSWPT